MKTQHTPTPVEHCTCGNKACSTYQLPTLGKFYQGCGFDEPTAKKLALAYDAHDDLVAALLHVERICTKGVDQSDDEIESAFAGLKEIARAALAKAGAA